MSQINNAPKIHHRQLVDQKRDKYSNVPKDYMRVAEGMEAQFTNHLLNQMRKTVHSVEPETQAGKMYKSMLDDERSKLMANSNSGLGIKDLVLDQIYPQYKQASNQQAVQMYKQNNSQQGMNNE